MSTQQTRLTIDRWGSIMVDPMPDRIRPQRWERAAFHVTSGRLTVEIGDLTALPSAHITEPDGAASWFYLLYGSAAHVAFLDLLTADEAGTSVTVTTEPGPLAAVIQRIGLGRWLRTWWPAEAYRPGHLPLLERHLLDAEIAVLMRQAEECFAIELVEELLAPAVAWLAERTGPALLGHGDGGEHALTGAALDAVDAVLIDAVETAVDIVDPGVRGIDRVHELAIEIAARRSEVDRGVDAMLLAAARPVRAAVRSGSLPIVERTLGEPLRSTFTIDWDLTPPGLIDSGQDAGTTEIVQVGSDRWRVDVSISAVRAEPVDAQLSARVVAGGARSVTSLRRQGIQYYGSAELSGEVEPTALSVSVFQHTDATTYLDGLNRARRARDLLAQATQDGVRTLARDRLSAAGRYRGFGDVNRPFAAEIVAAAGA